jgi:acetyltransferase-like isoleucine patch superfamily enzyme
MTKCEVSNGQKSDGETSASTGTDHFGAVVGKNCAIGASVIILPGRHVPANSII